MTMTMTEPTPRPQPTAEERPFCIERAERSDMDMIQEFVRSSAEWYRPFLEEKDMAEHDVDEQWAEKNFTRREFFLGYAGETAVGTVSIQEFGDYAYLGYIYLDVDYVGRGYGQKLIRFAERQARLRGLKGMCLIAHPKAKWADRAYRKYGFEQVATDRGEILEWNDGALETYYEEGFALYIYDFAKHSDPKTRS